MSNGTFYIKSPTTNRDYTRINSSVKTEREGSESISDQIQIDWLPNYSYYN